MSFQPEGRLSITALKERLLFLQVLGVGSLLLLWFVTGLTPALERASLPTIVETAHAFVSELVNPRYWSSIGDTLLAWLVSLVIGSVIGVTLGLFCGLNRWINNSLVVTVEFFKTIPIVAVLPLGILALGTGLTMRITLVSFAVIWPLLVQTVYGVRSIDIMVRDSARAIGVGPVRAVFSVILPSASPFIATGLRVAASMALIITIVIELIAGGSGLGVAISRASLSGVSAMPGMFALIFTAGLLGVLIVGIMSRLERKFLHWHATYQVGASHD